MVALRGRLGHRRVVERLTSSSRPAVAWTWWVVSTPSVVAQRHRRRRGVDVLAPYWPTSAIPTPIPNAAATYVATTIPSIMSTFSAAAPAT